MQLPQTLQNAIEDLTASIGTKQVTQARVELTERYRGSSKQEFMTTDAHRLSYLISRMPATYAALISSLRSLHERNKQPIRTFMDLGAGPGTGMWAACEIFPEIERVTLIEKDVSLMRMGKQLATSSGIQAMQSAVWKEGDLECMEDFPDHDLVMLSYSIGELKPERMLSLIDLCWKACKTLIIVEPGTPIGFERIRLIRHHLLQKENAYLIAPCPHQGICPMSEGDWCHFSARIERTSLHRKVKGGTLGYEDEKFSYLVASKTEALIPSSRVLREPTRHSGHLSLKLCTPDGVKTPTLSKKHGEDYKVARKLEWGDAWK